MDRRREKGLLELFVLGIVEIMRIDILFLIFLGVIAGIIAGLIPGFTVTMAIVLTLPFTFGMESITGIATMMGVFVGGMSGGLISAALLGIPGTPSAVATTFDAYPMAKKGKPGEALSIGIWASFFGSIVSMFALITIAPQVARMALKFGPWEMFSLIAFSLTIIASVTGDSILKGLMSGLFGLLIATIGADPIGGFSRFSFGIRALKPGIPFLVVLIGMFAMSRLLTELEWTKLKKSYKKTERYGKQDFKLYPLKTLRIVLSRPVNLLRSSLIGTLIGAIPGAGGSIANVVAYDQAKKWSKNPEEFGTGCYDGVIASEAGNNSTVGGALIPTIALGIPGGAVTAVMLSALMVHGVKPGPLLIVNEPAIVGSIFIAMGVATIWMAVAQFAGVKLFMKITKVPIFFLAPAIMALCAIGTFILNNRLVDLYSLLFMGCAGYILAKHKFALAPAIIGVILGPIAEVNLRRAVMRDPDWTLFVTRPISLAFLILAVASILLTLWQTKRAKERQRSAVPR